MYKQRQRVSFGYAGVAMLLLGTVSACQQSPMDQGAAGSRVVAPESAVASLGIVPPGAEREIRALLDAWTDAWNAHDGIAFGALYAADADFVNPLGGILSGRQAIAATHVFLFSGPFAGSSQTWAIRRMVALTGKLAIVDLNVALTGYAGLPPGLSATEPGVVRTRARLVVGKNNGRWEILAQQYTAIPPPAP